MAFRFLGLFLVVEACFLQVEPYRVAAQDQPAVTLVQGGFQFVEGPTMAADGAVYFTDIPANQILVWREGKKVEPWIEPSMHANGLMI